MMVKIDRVDGIVKGNVSLASLCRSSSGVRSCSSGLRREPYSLISIINSKSIGVPLYSLNSY